MDDLTKTWLLLIALTLGTALLSGFGGLAAAAGLLLLAWAKARAILGGFLHLKSAPGWLSAAMVPLGIWMALLWGMNAVLFR